MAETTVMKLRSATSPVGEMGEAKPEVSRDYELSATLSAEKLSREGQVVLLEPVDSWLVPQGARHSDRILESFTAVAAAHPPKSRAVTRPPLKPQKQERITCLTTT